MSKRILVVDDDQEIVRLLRAYLERDGYQVLTAYDGEKALYTIRHDHPGLVVLDLMLPDRDGWEVTRVVRGDPALAGTPIIMLTARIEDQDKIAGLELGADDYVTKPFSPRELVARVRAVLRRAGGEPAPAQVLRAGELLLDRANYTVTLQPVDLGEVAQDLAGLFEAEVVEKGGSLAVQVPPDLPPVLADPRRITQVVGNLLSNALRYAPTGVPDGQPLQVEIRLRRIEEGVLLSVSDNGAGVPEADLPHLFDRFWRGEKSRARVSGGAGLGLAIARQLVEAQGGRIWAENRAGGGLCVTLLIRDPQVERVRQVQAVRRHVPQIP